MANTVREFTLAKSGQGSAITLTLRPKPTPVVADGPPTPEHPSARLPKVHTLFFEYPCTDLLPQNINQPNLDPPEHFQHRPQPTASPEDAGVFSSIFYTTFPVQASTFPIQINNRHGGLIGRIAALANNEATSWLRFVIWQDPTSRNRAKRELLFRFQLRTDHHGLRTRTCDFTLNESEMQHVIDQKNNLQWANLMYHLVRRDSTRAYYHVRQQLIQGMSLASANAEERSWPTQWQPSPPRILKALFLARLKIKQVHLGYDPKMTFLLECGHLSTVYKSYLAQLSGTDCRLEQCRYCKKSIMQPSDDAEHRIWKDCVQVEVYTAKNLRWRILDHAPSDNPHELIQGNTILDATDQARKSLNPPALVCPLDLNHAQNALTQAAWDGIVHPRTHRDWNRLFTPHRLYHDLMAEIINQLVREGTCTPNLGGLPPGYEAFLDMWIRRGVNFLHDEFYGKRFFRDHVPTGEEGEQGRLKWMEENEVNAFLREQEERSGSVGELETLMRDMYIR